MQRRLSQAGNTGSGHLPFSAAWAAQARAQVNKDNNQRQVADDNSDSDEEGTGSIFSDESRAFDTPVPRNLLATIVVFGADGDLSHKKILPTLFNLWRRKLLCRDVLIFGYARAEMSSEEFRKIVFKAIYNPSQPQGERKDFLQRCHYQGGQFNDPACLAALRTSIAREEAIRIQQRRKGGAGYLRPSDLLAGKGLQPSPLRQESLDDDGDEMGEEGRRPEQVRMYYMAVPPFLYADIANGLRTPQEGEAERPLEATEVSTLGAPVKTTERFVLEKPFGRDTASCNALVRQMSVLSEEETFRIDHYLGKELVMNLLVLRFANVAFQAIWNRHYIKNVQVIFKEDFGIAGRGGYFDEYGMIRDVMQNHLIQVMALVAMEQPLSFDAHHIGAEKLKVLQSCAPLRMDDLVIGQYVSANGKLGYLEEPTVRNKNSNTETFAAAVLHVHNPRWDGVPFVLKAGKALTDRKAEVRIQFHRVPGVVSALANCSANELVVRLQPEETIYWKVQNKVPGLGFEVQQMRMDLMYASRYEKKLPEAYERLLLEVLAGNQSNFVSAAELDASWRIFTPILHHLAEQRIKPEPYTYGTRGPVAADALAHRYGMTKFGGGIHPCVNDTPLKMAPVRAPSQ